MIRLSVCHRHLHQYRVWSCPQTIRQAEFERYPSTEIESLKILIALPCHHIIHYPKHTSPVCASFLYVFHSFSVLCKHLRMSLSLNRELVERTSCPMLSTIRLQTYSWLDSRRSFVTESWSQNEDWISQLFFYTSTMITPPSMCFVYRFIGRIGKLQHLGTLK